MNAAFNLDAWSSHDGGELRRTIRGAIVSWWTFESFVSVSIDDGATWTNSTRAVRDLADAEYVGEGLIDALRATNAARKFPRGPNAIARLDGSIDKKAIASPAAMAELESVEARKSEPGARRAPSHSGLRPEPQKGPGKRHARHSLFRVTETQGRDLPQAVELAREHLATLHDSIESQGGNGALFGAAVALVRGFGLLPTGYGLTVLEEYNRAAVPPWTEKELVHALDNAERHGRMAWGVLFFAALAERRWRGGGAGEGTGAR